MYLKPIFTFVVLFLFGFVLTVPVAPPQTQEELIKDIAEFLRENKEVASALRNVDMNSLMTRTRRDAIDDDVEEMDKMPDQKDSGFFDRAAKFVMEVLQRFLKWINTDN